MSAHDHRDVTVQESVEEPSSDPVTFREVAPALEFACWVVVGLAPFLRWVNGAAVTDDQFVFQVAITSGALLGALALRVYNYRHGRSPAAAQSQRE